jgi:hypothetical protein
VSEVSRAAGGSPAATRARGAHGTAAAAAKLIVVGPGEAGKSTLIARLVEGAVNLAVRGRTVAMDHGMLRRAGARLSLVGVPGQSRFAAVREALSVGAVGAVWVHPAGEAADAETAALLGSTRPAPLPYLVYVNHRAGASLPSGFEAPPLLAPPRGVFAGDLADSDLGDLIDSVWTLSGLAPAGWQKEREP